MSSWRPTAALVRSCLLALGGVTGGIVLGQEVLVDLALTLIHNT